VTIDLHIAQVTIKTMHLVSSQNYCYYYICLTAFFSRTTWVSRDQKGKPFWILLEQEMMGWQWHQLEVMRIICTSLQTHNHANASPLFLQAECPSCRLTKIKKTLNAILRNNCKFEFVVP